MTVPTLSELQELAKQAGEILRAGYEQEHEVAYKGVIDPVTEVDRASEAFLLGEINRRWPGSHILSEEAGVVPGDREHAWYVDPLEGTVNYAHGIPFFSVSIAYAHQGTRDIPVVFLSATYVSPEDKDFARTLGAARFIEKPIDIEKFLVTIAEVLDEPPIAPPELLKEREFLEKYETRLMAKLEQKNAQIERAQRLLQTATPSEVTGFEASLRQALHEKQAIEVELQNVHQIMQRPNSSQ